MMKTHLVVHEQPVEFIKVLDQYIKKAENESYIIRDIKYGDSGERYSALLILIKVTSSQIKQIGDKNGIPQK